MIILSVIFLLLFLGALGVAPFYEILNFIGEWVGPVFEKVPRWPLYLLWIVFFPVFRVATFIEKRVWLCWVWAFAASAVALAILYFQHRI